MKMLAAQAGTEFGPWVTRCRAPFSTAALRHPSLENTIHQQTDCTRPVPGNRTTGKKTKGQGLRESGCPPEHPKLWACRPTHSQVGQYGPLCTREEGSLMRIGKVRCDSVLSLAGDDGLTAKASQTPTLELLCTSTNNI